MDQSLCSLNEHLVRKFTVAYFWPEYTVLLSHSRNLSVGAAMDEGQVEWLSTVVSASMTEGRVDWLTAVIVGGVAGWMANKFMHAHAHLATDIVAGVVGAVILNAIAERLGFHYGGWVAFFGLGFFGACLLLLPIRLVRVRMRPPRAPDDW
ncbi:MULTISPECIES: GlsB/YeaQ/YmgE family stress response membrane protein [unclassified Rhizobium]|uniref:GlsB/YeaQ/YmgE family stress response membrane protein n=1 Tax=unclassified Rhizobium TaxID=2613769 RepID=UPI0017D0FB7B|nr:MULTISPECIES: GlsB/YeaQ/YmgE family stress response membrane protein [unclassified Rhizobium]MBB3542187.1 putative membrane protein YeaQ/YmgE (transglycosylase-associated protein family) [Rhizobium sp. BK399]MCS3744319.1 putative membrane protein YeaQ/YmgE (transglycosylase-associated protein family) [Rhizobium sp. BK661]MCS4094311.1 putative membrane protein YeaQ/YmgE (transglycosylase-associated protein family) [Rhizobium sp. BK176]